MVRQKPTLYRNLALGWSLPCKTGRKLEWGGRDLWASRSDREEEEDVGHSEEHRCFSEGAALGTREKNQPHITATRVVSRQHTRTCPFSETERHYTGVKLLRLRCLLKAARGHKSVWIERERVRVQFWIVHNGPVGGDRAPLSVLN